MEEQRKTYDAKLDDIRSRHGEHVIEETDEQKAARLERELNRLAIQSAVESAL